MIGPAEATVKKISDVYRQVLYIKSGDLGELRRIKDQAEQYTDAHPIAKGRVTFDFDPLYGY